MDKVRAMRPRLEQSSITQPRHARVVISRLQVRWVRVLCALRVCPHPRRKAANGAVGGAICHASAVSRIRIECGAHVVDHGARKRGWHRPIHARVRTRVSPVGAPLNRAAAAPDLPFGRGGRMPKLRSREVVAGQIGRVSRAVHHAAIAPDVRRSRLRKEPVAPRQALESRRSSHLAMQSPGAPGRHTSPDRVVCKVVHPLWPPRTCFRRVGVDLDERPTRTLIITKKLIRHRAAHYCSGCADVFLKWRHFSERGEEKRKRAIKSR